jgi:hypothetical protein
LLTIVITIDIRHDQEEEMSKAQEIGQKVQGETLDAVRKTQDAVVEAVTAWTETANKIPGYARLTKPFPAATEVIDSNFDFAQQILTSQRDFAGRIVAATAPKATKKIAPKAIKKTAPAATRKSAARKTATAAKKSSAVQPRSRRSKSR